MSTGSIPPSRRRFVTQLGRIASLAAVGSIVPSRVAGAAEAERGDGRAEDRAPGAWDLSWIARLDGTANRGVFDWSTIETPPEAAPLDYASRYLDGCAAAYGDGTPARAVIVIRHMAIPAALNDAAWNRYAIGEGSKIDDPVTHKPAVRNPFWTATSHDEDTPPSLQDLIGRGVIVLVCNLALTHAADRIARAHGDDPASVRRTLVSSIVPNGYMVPSGVWGLVRAQNAGCGLMRA